MCKPLLGPMVFFFSHHPGRAESIFGRVRADFRRSRACMDVVVETWLAMVVVGSRWRLQKKMDRASFSGSNWRERKCDGTGENEGTKLGEKRNQRASWRRGKLGGKKTRQWEERRWERQSIGVRIRGAAPVPFVWDFANCELFKERCDSKAFHQSSYVCTSTTFVSFVGWILFASVFFLFAWQEFDESGVDGRPLVESLAPKLDVFSKHMSANVGV